jgi:serine/threonine protein kinase
VLGRKHRTATMHAGMHAAGHLAWLFGYSDPPDLATSHGDHVSQPKPDIPGYRILRRLGHGGMSEIWLAEQVALARPVAVKVVSLGQEADARLARFRQEASLIARFDHPNVVGIIEFGDTGDGRLFFSMPYVPNGTLAEAGLRGDSERVREVIAQILDALAYVHQHGVVHRDVKPENVLFDNVGRARLADFGVSRSMEGVSRHTRVGETFGSSYYLSPEQARGETLDGRSDLYSLGAVVYELLTGLTPFQGPDDLSIVVAHLQAPVPRLPPELRHWQGWIDTALAKRADHRFADAAAMRAAMDRLPSQSSRRRWMSTVLPPAVVAALLLTIAIVLIVRGRVGGDIADSEISESPSASAVRGTEEASDAIAMAEPGISRTAEPETAGARPQPPTGDTESPPTPGTSSSDDGTSSVDETASARSEGRRPGRSDPGDPFIPDTAVSTRATRLAPPTTRRTNPTPVTPFSPKSVAPAFSTSFQTVPRIPLYLLAGTQAEQLDRIDEHLDWGRRAIEADRVDVEGRRRATDDRGLRRRLRNDYDARKVNYETWRRQLLELRKKAERSD